MKYHLSFVIITRITLQYSVSCNMNIQYRQVLYWVSLPGMSCFWSFLSTDIRFLCFIQTPNFNSKHSQASFVKCNIVFTMNAGLTWQWLQCKLTLIAAMPQKPKGFASSTSVPPTGTTPMSTTAACTTLTFILARLRSWSVTNAFWVNRMHWCCNVYKWKTG